MPNAPHLWEAEYAKKGIPSSYKEEVSGAINLLLDYFEKNRISFEDKTALDLGCGTGRNTFALLKKGVPKAYAIDFVYSQIERVRMRAKAFELENRVVPVCHDLTKSWPIQDNSIDIIIDIFCFKHQTEEKDHNFYKEEIKRVLKPGGYLLLSLAGTNDGYYGSLHKIRIREHLYKITDPKTQVSSFLFTKEGLLMQFPEFTLVSFAHDYKMGPMHGKSYRRSTLKFLFQKN